MRHTGSRSRLSAIPKSSKSLLGLQTPLSEWAESFGLAPDQRQPDDDPERDGLDNLVEFALGLDPSAPSKLPAAIQISGGLEYEYQLAPRACDQIVTIPEYSQDLIRWQRVAEESISPLPDNRFRVSLTAPPQMRYLRLKFEFRATGSP